MVDGQSNLASETNDSDLDQELVQRLALDGWHTVVDDATIHFGTRQDSRAQSGFTVKCERLADAFAPFAPADRSEEAIRQLKSDIANLVLTNMKCKFLEKLLYYMQICSRIQRSFVCQFRIASTECNRAKEQNNTTECREELMEVPQAVSGNASCLGIKYAISDLLLLIESIQKKEPVILKDVLHIVGDLFRAVDLKNLIEDLQKAQGAKCMEPLFLFFHQIVCDETTPEIVGDKELAAVVLVKLAVLSGSIRWILRSLESLLRLSGHVHFCLSDDFLEIVSNLQVSFGVDRGPGSASDVSEFPFPEQFEPNTGSLSTSNDDFITKPHSQDRQCFEYVILRLILEFQKCLGELCPLMDQTSARFENQVSAATLSCYTRRFSNDISTETLLSFVSFIKLSYDRYLIARDAKVGRILLSLMKVLKLHINLLNSANFFQTISNTSDTEEFRSMLMHLISCEIGDKYQNTLLVEVQLEATRIVTAGLELFFPTVATQIGYILQLMKTRDDPRTELSLAESHLLQLLFVHLASVQYARNIMLHIHAHFDFSDEANGFTLIAAVAQSYLGYIDKIFDEVVNGREPSEVDNLESRALNILQPVFLSRILHLLELERRQSQIISPRSVQLVSKLVDYFALWAEGAKSMFQKASTLRVTTLIKLDTFFKDRLVYKIIHPLLVFALTLPLTFRSVFSLNVHDATTNLLKSLSLLRTVIITSPLQSKDVKTHIIESSHPYHSNSTSIQVIRTGKCDTMEFAFDPRSRTTDQQDVIEVYFGEGSTKQKIGHFFQQEWRGPAHPIKPEASSLTVCFYSKSSSPPDWGYLLKVNAITKRVPFFWLHELSRCVAVLCGNLTAAILDGFAITEEETANQYWLEAGLLQGSFECGHPLSKNFDDLVEIANISPQHTAPAISSDQNELEFLKEIENHTGRGAVLINKLNSFANFTFPIPKSIKPLAELATRVVFAVMLKHSARIDQASQYSAESIAIRPDDVILRLWRKSTQMEAIVASRFGQGYERETIIDQILRKAHFLLSISVSKPTVPLLSLTRQNSGSMSHVYPMLFRCNSASRNTLRRTLRAMRIIKNDSYFSANSQDKFDNVLSSSAKDCDSLISKQILQFIEDQTLDVDSLERSIIRHRSRAVLRLAAIERFHAMLNGTTFSDLRRDMVYFFSQSICRRNDPICNYADDIAVPAIHLLSSTECAGKILHEKLLSSYYGLISTLINSFSEGSEFLLILNLMNFELRYSDIEYLQKIGALRFLKPMLTYTSHFKWNARYVAWSQFRLFAYSCAQIQGHDQDSSSELFDSFQLEILDIIFNQLQMLQNLRAESTFLEASSVDAASCEPLLVYADSWSCNACTFLNEKASEFCSSCGIFSGSKGKQVLLWPCHRCTFLNKSFVDICAICDTSRKPSVILMEYEVLSNQTTKTIENRKLAIVKNSRLSSMPEDSVACYWRWTPSVKLTGVNILQPTTAVFSDDLATVFSHAEIKHHFFVHVESDFSVLKIGVALHSYFSANDSSVDMLLESILYDAVTGTISKGSEILAACEPYGTGDVVTVQQLAGSIIFFKNSVIQGTRIRGICVPFLAAVTARNCTISLVEKDAFVRRSSDWNIRASKMSLESASIAWFALEFAELGGNSTRHASYQRVSVEEVDLLINQFLWVLARCCSTSSFQRVICFAEWIRVIVLLVTDMDCHPITKTLALRICRSIFPLVSPSSEFFYKIKPNSICIIHFFMEAIGEISLKFKGSCSSFALWSASETVALVRFLWLDDSWSLPISNIIRRTLHSMCNTFEDKKSLLLRYENSASPDFDSDFFRQLALFFGVLHVIGAWIEPLREGSRVLFTYNGTSHEGVVSSHQVEPFQMIIDGGSQVADAIQVKSAEELELHRIQAISEIDVLHETMCHISVVILETVKIFLVMKDESEAHILRLLQVQIKRMLSRVLQQTLQNGNALRSVIQNSGLAPILSLAVTPCMQKSLNNFLKLESRYLWLWSRYEPELCTQADFVEKDINHSQALQSSKCHATVKAIGGPGGQVVSFGKGDNGRLGLGNNSTTYIPTVLPGFGPVHNAVISISCFSSHIIALTNIGVPFTWGKGDDGRLGHGGTAPESSPRQIKAMEGTRCIQVCAGLNFSFILDEDGSLWGFGSNANGQIGIGAFPSQMSPIRVKNDLEDKTVVKVCAGGSHVLAITSNGNLYSWGKNVFGQLGHGTTQKICLPKIVKAAESLSFALIAGGWEHSMAVTSDGRLYTWGAGYEGNRPVCGHGSNEKELVPRQVEGLVGKVVVHIAAGWDHSLAITNDGKLYSWGHGNFGMLGHGTVAPANVPTLVEGAFKTEKCVWADGGQDHTIVVTSRGQVWAFGSAGAHAGADVSTAIHQPQLIKNTPPGMVFGTVSCGDKCTLLLSSQIPRSVPSKPMLQCSGLTPLPVYPLRLHFCGDPQHFFSNDGSITEFVFGRSALVSRHDSSPAVEAEDSVNQYYQKVSLDIDGVELRFSCLSLSVCVNLSRERSATLFSLKWADNIFEVSYENRLLFSLNSHMITETVVNLHDGEWHTVMLSGNGELLDLFVDGVPVWSKPLDGPRLNSSISGIEFGPVAGSIRDLSLWDVALTSEQIASVANSGMSFVLSDLQLDETHRQNWQLVDFSLGQESVVDANNDASHSSYPRNLLGKSKIWAHGSFEFAQDDKGYFLRLPDQSFLQWFNPWSVENSPFSIVMEIKAHSDQGIVLFSLINDPSVQVVWACDGRFQLSEVSSDICPVDRRLWNRIVVTFENDVSKRFSVYINGIPYGDFTYNQLIHLQSGLTVLPCNFHDGSISIRFVEIFRSCLTAKDISDIGSASDPIISSSLISSISGTLHQIGFPPSWVHRAMVRCSFNRYDACKWIMNNETVLRKEDALAKLHEDARCLNIMDIPLGDCSQALQAHDGDYVRALSFLMETDDFYAPRVHIPGQCSYKEQLRDLNIVSDESAVSENPAYRILETSAEEWREVVFTPNSADAENPKTDAVLASNQIVFDMIQLDCQLTIAYSRHTILGVIRNFANEESYGSFSLEYIGGLEFLAKFLRLISFMRLGEALSALKELMVHLLYQEMEAHISSIQQVSVPKLAKFAVFDCLVHLIGVCLNPVVIDSEMMALQNPNVETGLWYLEIFVLMHRRSMALSDPRLQNFILTYLLCPPLISVVFKMLSITNGQTRLQLLLVLFYLAKTGVPFDSSKCAFLKKQLFIMHKRYKESRIFPNFFQALLEFVLLLDQRSVSNLLITTSPLWYRQFSELRQLLSIFLEKVLQKDITWPPIFLNSVVESLKLCHELVDIVNAEEEVHINRLEFDHDCDMELILCLNRILSSAVLPSNSQQTPRLLPNPAQLSSFERINNHSLRSIHIRCVILYQLNDVISSAISLINLSRTNEESEISCMLRRARGLIFPLTKNALWFDILNRTATDTQVVGISRDLKVQVNRFSTASWKECHKVDLKGTKTCFGQVFRQVHHISPALLRLKREERAWKTVFQGEFSDDYGGPYRNCLDLICDELQSAYLPLFVACPNKRSKIGVNQDKFVPNPASSTPLYMSMYEFVGKLMGIAIRSRNLLNLNLPSIVWKPLVSETITKADVIEIDAVAFRVISNIRRMESDNQITPENFEEVLSMTFSVSGSDGQEVDLVPDGSSIPVTWKNKDEFISALVEFRNHEFSLQCHAIRRGLSSIVPFPMLSLFSWKELELQVCGHSHVDIQLLKSMTQYEWCSPADPHICAFWEVLSESFDDAQRSDFLKFVWGRSRLPVNVSDFDCKFKVSNMPRARQDPDMYLPISHTCFFSIELPRYTSKEILHRRLLYAITHCVSIDADSTSAAQSSARMMPTASLSDNDID